MNFSRIKIFFLLTFCLMPSFSYSLITFKNAFAPDCPFRDKLQSPKLAIANLFDVLQTFRGKLDQNWEIVPLEDNNETLQQEIQRQKDLIGTALSITYIKDKTANSQVPTLYFHGWKDKKESSFVLKKFCKILPGDLITFDFPDAMLNIWRSSFGQKNEILAALYALNYIVEKRKLNAIDLFGISRGTAVIVNMLAVLNDETLFQEYKTDLEKIGINEEQRFKLLDVIQNGCIVLNTPLRTMKEAALPLWLIKRITIYKEDGLNPIESAPLLKGLKLKILVHFQHNDKVVLNLNEAAYFKALAQHNPDTTYLVMGNDGGHQNTQAALSKTIDAFKKLASQDSNNTSIVTINDASQTLENGTLINFANLKVLELVLKNYHAQEDNKEKSSFSKIGGIKTIAAGLAIMYAGVKVYKHLY